MANLIEVTSGRMNMRTKSCEMFVFYCPTPDKRGVDETHLGRCAKDFRGFVDAPVRAQGPAQWLDGVNGMTGDIGGRVSIARFQVEEGAILKVYGKKREGWNSPQMMGVRYLRVRDGAAYRKIEMTVVRDNRAVVPRLEIKGRFDVIGLEDARRSGVRITKMAQGLWNKCKGSNGELLQITIIDAEREAPMQEVEVKVETKPDGSKESKRMLVRPRRRKIDEV